MTTRERFILTLETSRRDPLNRPALVRIKQLLKLAGRAFNFRCVSVRQVEPANLSHKLIKPPCNGQDRDKSPQ